MAKRTAKSRTPLSKLGRIFLVAIMSVLGALVLLVAAILVNAALVQHRSEVAQRNRLETISAEVGSLPDGTFSDWQEVPIPDDTPFTSVQTIATHNSYGSQPSALQLFAIGVAQPGMARTLKYSHPPVWEQLDLGIRSFEFDLRPHTDGSFTLTHVPLVANGSPEPNFAPALEEIALWSQTHPNHLPLTILIEFKSDFAFLDPSLESWNESTLNRTDAVIREVLGNALMTPAELNSEQWPNIRDLRGRVMIFMHPEDQVITQYLEFPLAQRAMFVGRYADSPEIAGQPQFVVQNEPDVKVIRDLVSKGALVRTRADEDLQTDLSHAEAAINSGAQIISTDFPAYPRPPLSGATHARDDYRVGFPDDRLTRVID